MLNATKIMKLEESKHHDNITSLFDGSGKVNRMS
jgi:hypothetical protein